MVEEMIVELPKTVAVDKTHIIQSIKQVFNDTFLLRILSYPFFFCYFSIS